jgi:hypothetical protein
MTSEQAIRVLDDKKTASPFVMAGSFLLFDKTIYIEKTLKLFGIRHPNFHKVQLMFGKVQTEGFEKERGHVAQKIWHPFNDGRWLAGTADAIFIEFSVHLRTQTSGVLLFR